jgi:hypothetical protein
MVDAQVEAAYTYQAMGDRGKPKYYEKAIQGGKNVKTKDGSVFPLVWGWGKIARLISPMGRGPLYEPIFHEARYNLALCRYKLALSQKSREQRKALAEQAERDILVIQRLYPEMGGEPWYDRYDALLKKIQTELYGRDKAVGLKATEREGTSARGANTSTAVASR